MEKISPDQPQQINREVEIKNFPKSFLIKMEKKHFWKDLKFLIPTLIAIVSLLFSLNVFSWFNLEIYTTGSYIKVAYEPQNSITIITPFTFLNKGKDDGVIEEIYYTINKNEKIYKFSPFYEVDLTKLTQDRPQNPKEFWLNPFEIFNLGGKESLRKTIHFTIEPPNPQLHLQKDTYLLELFIKTSKDKKAKKIEELKITITDQNLEEYKNNKFIFFRKTGTKDVLRLSD